ncbi:MAG: adenylate/guanylate cyclase domain-containing protein [Candidatus Moranbacteria bacterium]|nr:adenylate/guanylate cyclase domain-containing protein [Candidatus Moranbacteria bacterium]
MPEQERYQEEISDILNSAYERYQEETKVESVSSIPTVLGDFSLESNKWLRIDDVTCVFIDMKNSTQLSAQKHDKSTAAIYQYFTDTAVRILDHFGATYIDVRGDGAFGLFDSNRLYHALAAAVSFKTFSANEIGKHIQIEDGKITCHIGIDRKTVLVKRIGLRRSSDGTDKQNEVWAGKPVNMASKLASRGEENDLLISERVFNLFSDDGSELVLKSCGCGNSGQKTDLWTEEDVSQEPKFDFDKLYKLSNSIGWCDTHGKGYCEAILALDENSYD